MVHQATYCERATCLHVTFAFAFLAAAAAVKVSQRGEKRIGVNKRNSRIGALAVRVIAGLVNEDSVAQLLSESGEYTGGHEPVEVGMLTDHGRRLSSVWLKVWHRPS